MYRTEINRELSRLLGSSRSHPIPDEFYVLVERMIRRFTQNGGIKSALEREAEYGPMIRQELKRHDLPEEFVYLALIESHFRFDAVSHAGAVGMWQFMPETAREAGLRVDSWVDERRDPVRSTQAALRHLKSLYDKTHDWALVAAAYNAGLGRIQRAQKEAGQEDYFMLASRKFLPQETIEYVPKIVAASLVAHNPARFGLRVRRSGPAFSYQGVLVPKGASLKTIARATGVSLAELERLNPHLLRGQAPPDREYMIWFPGTIRVDGFSQTIAWALAQSR